MLLSMDSLHGMRVVDISTNSPVGEVSNVFIDTSSGKVVSFCVKGELGVRAVPFGNIVSIMADAIFINGF